MDPTGPTTPATHHEPLAVGAVSTGPLTVEALIQPPPATTTHAARRLDLRGAQRQQLHDQTVDHTGRCRAGGQGVGDLKSVGQPGGLTQSDRGPLHGAEHVAGVQGGFDGEHRPNRSGVSVSGACRRALRVPTRLTPRRPVGAAGVDGRHPAATDAAVDVRPPSARRAQAAP
jgi:hypothetical protein